jgi:RNA polymerase sigma-70 factor (ECF subfamily)
MSDASNFSDETNRRLENLLSRLAAGDPGGRDDLIAIGSERMRGIAHRMLRTFPTVRRWDETDDVVQNAAIRLYRALSQITPRDPRGFMGLAAVQVRRELLDLARKHAGPESYGANHETNVQRVDGQDSPKIEMAPSVLDNPDQLERWTKLHDEAGKLPEEEREVFHLVWYMGLKQEEIASLLGCSVRTVKRRWDSAKMLIARAVGGDAL